MFMLTLHRLSAASIEDYPSFPLPIIPDTLTEAADRANYAIEHFWDNLDIHKPEFISEPNYSEQAFADFVHILHYATDPNAVNNGLSTLINKVAVDSDATQIFNDLIVKYLNGYDSPVRNDTLFIKAAQMMLDSAALDDISIQRLTYRIKLASKNQIGTEATDFLFQTPDSFVYNLLSVTHDGYIILLFYDPQCNNCNEVESILANSETIERLTKRAKVNIMAVSVEGDEIEWLMKIQDLPSDWIHGFNDGEIQESELYDLGAIPSIYLLDKDNTIVLKDVDIFQLLDYIENNISDAPRQP